MLKKMISVILTLCIMLGAAGASAAGESALPRASHYLDEYAIVLVSNGDGTLTISYTVCATGFMTKLGAQSIKIEKGSATGWTTVETLYGSDNDDFYSYDSILHGGDVVFTGEYGKIYRATLTAYAGNSSGSDTKSLTCTAEVCK